MIPSLLALVTSDAAACGGFFCNNAVPVLQNAERIVFGLDDERGWVEMHVQVTYEGDAEDFAWVVPVPEDPELMVSNSTLFTSLAVATQPQFVLNQRTVGHCSEFGPTLITTSRDYSVSAGGPVPSAAPESGGVDVVAEEAVGPYDTVTLQAETPEALLDWLDTHGYDLPDGVDAALAPYVGQDAYFVALKLQKDRDAGDLVPLALRYDGTRAMVPVQLTSIAAAPDLRMEAYVLGQARAVPESYLHVRINDAAIDWWRGGPNYAAVITQAADEAGGHAFATDYFGTSGVAAPIWDEAAFDEAALRSTTGMHERWIEALRGPVLAPSPELFALIEDVLALAPGQGAQAWACPECVVPIVWFDADLATDTFLERVGEPMATAQRLLDRYAFVTRMTSSLDAVEMTVDPTFVLNRDMTAPVPLRRTATLVVDCGNGRPIDRSPQQLVLADGRAIDLPSSDWLGRHGLTPFQYLEELGATKAQVIEQTGPSGLPLRLVDHTAAFFEAVRRHNRRVFGCDVGGAGLGAAAGAALVAATLRRRRP